MTLGKGRNFHVIMLRKETKIIIDSHLGNDDLEETDTGQHFVIDFFMIDPVKKFL